MNKLIVSTAALLLLAAAPAVAADLIIEEPAVVVAPADWGSLYVEIYGGAHFLGTSDYTGTQYDMDPGYAIGGAIGLMTPVPGLAFEIDVMATGSEYSDYPGEFVDTFSVMANAEYGVALNEMFEVYGALGLGAVNLHYHQDGNPLNDSNGWGAGYQVAVGARAHVTEDVSVFSELKYQNTFAPVELFDGSDDAQIPTLSAWVGLRLSF
jgi:opacity protein-like surface antigen